MTFSVVAKCPRTGQFGVGAVTAMPAVGKLVSYAAAGTGALASQARLNPYLGIDGLALLRSGLAAPDVMRRLLGEDPRADLRQFALIDSLGRTAAWTGDGCPGWAGAEEHGGFTVQGNRLAGPEVLRATAAAFERESASALADRFLAALSAGVEVGGDTKGERSATIYVVDTEEYPLWDVRVDEHDHPIAELRRLHGIFRSELLPQIEKMPTRANPAGEFGEDTA